MSRDEMDEAHSRDTRYHEKLRAARLALRELLDDDRLPAQMWDDVDTLHRRFGREMGHVVARWN